MMESKHQTSTSQASPNPGVETGGGHKVPPVAEELLSCDSCREGKGQFSSGMQTLRASHVPVDGPSIHAQAGSISGLNGLNKVSHEIRRKSL